MFARHEKRNRTYSLPDLKHPRPFNDTVQLAEDFWLSIFSQHAPAIFISSACMLLAIFGILMVGCIWAHKKRKVPPKGSGANNGVEVIDAKFFVPKGGT